MRGAAINFLMNRIIYIENMRSWSREEKNYRYYHKRIHRLYYKFFKLKYK